MSQSCFYHPAVGSRSVCCQCGMPLCGDCTTDVDGRIACKQCEGVVRKRSTPSLVVVGSQPGLQANATQIGRETTNQPYSYAAKPAVAKSGDSMAVGSMPRYFAAIAALAVIGIAWAFLWETIYVNVHINIGLVNFFVGIGMGITMCKVWGVGGPMAALTGVLMMTASLGLGHWLIYENYAPQIAEATGATPSFEQVMSILGPMHWIVCAVCAVRCLEDPPSASNTRSWNYGL